MKNLVFKTYEIEEVLNLYVNRNGKSQLWNDSVENKQIKIDLLEDIDIPEKETKETTNIRIKRYQKIVKILKQKYEYKCQLCGYSFHMDNGNDYCEAHHIKMLSDDGSQSKENVIILCANHHKMFHYARDAISIGKLIDNKRIIKIDNGQFTIQF
ncbi:HNH endonuclease [Acetobacterium bakii]|uniref:HNH endonuclease n=1 Tax=Acetobacterium bakii TaxID=52689 RepID=UPI0006817FCE|nr:HNH endonuclease [Acetobacterium bakii]